jgi:hypothetical protein
MLAGRRVISRVISRGLGKWRNGAELAKQGSRASLGEWPRGLPADTSRQLARAEARTRSESIKSNQIESRRSFIVRADSHCEADFNYFNCPDCSSEPGNCRRIRQITSCGSARGSPMLMKTFSSRAANHISGSGRAIRRDGLRAVSPLRRPASFPAAAACETKEQTTTTELLPVQPKTTMMMMMMIVAAPQKPSVLWPLRRARGLDRTRVRLVRRPCLLGPK